MITRSHRPSKVVIKRQTQFEILIVSRRKLHKSWGLQLTGYAITVPVFSLYLVSYFNLIVNITFYYYKSQIRSYL